MEKSCRCWGSWAAGRCVCWRNDACMVPVGCLEADQMSYVSPGIPCACAEASGPGSPSWWGRHHRPRTSHLHPRSLPHLPHQSWTGHRRIVRSGVRQTGVSASWGWGLGPGYSSWSACCSSYWLNSRGHLVSSVHSTAERRVEYVTLK